LVQDHIHPTVQQRGAAIIRARGASSAASAASAAIDHMRTWAQGTADGDWASMGISVRRQLRHRAGRDLRLSGTCKNGKFSIVPGLEITRFRASAWT